MGPLHFNTALTYGVSDLKSKRYDRTTGSHKTATPSVQEWNAFAELGYDIALDNVATGLVLTPNVEVLYINSRQDAFKEKGDGDSQLTVTSSNHQDWVARTGAQLSYRVPDVDRPREYRVGLGYQKSFLGNAGLQAGYPSGAVERLKTTSYGNRSVYYNAGYSMMMPKDQSVHFDYFGSTGKKSQSHALALTYEWKF